jgi:hypothetical protein
LTELRPTAEPGFGTLLEIRLDDVGDTGPEGLHVLTPLHPRIANQVDSVLTAVPCVYVCASIFAQLGALLGVAWSLPFSLSAVAAGLVLNRLILVEGSRSRRSLGRVLALDAVGLVSLGAVLCLAASTIYDLSWDGRAYHLEAIIALADGGSILDSVTGNVYADHYPRGSWIATNLVHTFTGHLESAKVWGLALGLTAFHWTFGSLGLLGHRSALHRAWCALLITLSPVLVMEAFTHLVDGVLSAWLLLLANAIYRAIRVPERRNLAMIALASSGLVSAKFTGLAYAVVLLTGYAGWTMLVNRAQSRRAIGIVAGSLAFAFLVTCFSPYVTNMIRHANPFYPAVESTTKHVLALEASQEFLSKDRLRKFLLSSFGESANDRGGAPTFKVPGVVSMEEIATFSVEDVRFGGWGPLYSLALIVSLLLAVSVALDPRLRLPFCFAYAVLLGSIFVIPEPWWAKIVPQAHWLPLLPVVAGLPRATPMRRIVGHLVLVIMTANLAMVAARQLTWNRGTTLEVKHQLEWLANESRKGESQAVKIRLFEAATTRRLTEAGVEFRTADELPCRIRMHEPTGVMSFCITLSGAVEVDSSSARRWKSLLDVDSDS